MSQHLVMVVDDDRDTCAAMTELLEDSGYRTLSARNGVEALRQLRSPVKPSLILIDLQMPGMGGEALCKACDSLPELAAIPRVVVSGGKELTAIDCKAHALVAKPVKPDQLLKVLSQVLDGGSSGTPPNLP